MASTKLIVSKCPSDELAMTNCVIASPGDFPIDVKYITIHPTPDQEFSFVLKVDPAMPHRQLGFTFHQRKFARLELDKEISVEPFRPDKEKNIVVGNMTIQLDFQPKDKTRKASFDSAAILAFLKSNFNAHVFSVGQQFVFSFQQQLLLAEVQKIEVVDVSVLSGKRTGSQLAANRGVLLEKSDIFFTKGAESNITLTGKARISARPSPINPDFDFEQMGIGGLGGEFASIFRRAFASRVMPPSLLEQLGITHVKGILLYGPPGTGKTLMARQIGKMLKTREPKIVNGPEILSKFVGESEKNIRDLFAEAEAEYKSKGEDSSLHMIVFDEIDAICKQRGARSDNTGVHDTVVNQLLSKMDGVEQLNNILIIGMTNRRDMIDEALLRPGRLEVQLEISLPDEKGRVEILKIHTAQLRKNERLATDVNLQDIAAETKNYSGAELAGVVRSAASYSMNRLVKASKTVAVSDDAEAALKVTNEDFQLALLEVKSAFGADQDSFESMVLNGIINWSPAVQSILTEGLLHAKQVKNSARTPLVSVLLEGPVGSGKTALAVKMALQAQEAGFPFVRLVSAEKLVGMTEAAKSSAIAKAFDDSYKSPLSVIIIDEIERLLDYAPIGPRFSNSVLQTLLVLAKRLPPTGRKLLIIATTSHANVVNSLGLEDAFDVRLTVPNLNKMDQVRTVLKEIDAFTEQEWRDYDKYTRTLPFFSTANPHIWIGIKKLLMLIEMAAQDESSKVVKFLSSLQDACGQMDTLGDESVNADTAAIIASIKAGDQPSTD
ncbi:N-ethylmaleimide-sensitive factor b [Capsaspora owczarzaki ATCC 30864]|uniref:Vesicle-fusing ATPase n=1 Tax=Capsaspora owczarzaki (strain ATCC 30864) TaxID=595528 RepID=A0A0D2WNX2_CAPO3|nr:N-ethylmaleimide-sensitive factor b [Capsaspora owczarzaki ATCC 30864]KJE92965.1 N-ethylmaleimide-sensitive factor b [Capsaspora owczarzaki ATCC 30864]|eukprot:XP_004363563.1 N-ethylmaleimide-sensitive factor b [Capsaspora owczarzaki ATCC 30864]